MYSLDYALIITYRVAIAPLSYSLIDNQSHLVRNDLMRFGDFVRGVNSTIY